jgi:hypothetical protein
MSLSWSSNDLKESGYNPLWYLEDAENNQMMDLTDSMACHKAFTMLDFVERRLMEV